MRRRARLRADAGAVRLAGEVLLDQQVASGIGNIYRCESLFLCEINPWMPVDDLGDAQIDALMLTAARLMKASAGATALPQPPRRRPGRGRVGRVEGPRGRAWVYGRSGKPCRRCGTVVRSQRLGRDARTAYWCPTCQPAVPINHQVVAAVHEPASDGPEDR